MTELNDHLYKKLLNLSTQAMALTDREGYIHYVNRACTDLFDFTDEEMIGNRFIDLLRKEDEQPYQALYHRLFTEPVSNNSLELDLETAKGKTCSVIVRFDFVLENDQKSAMICIFEDNTERNKILRNLEINDERYRKAQKLGNVGNWEYHLQTNEIWGSDQAKRIYGFDPQTDLFALEEVESCIIERERVHQALVDLVEKNKPYQLEFEIIPKDSKNPRTIVSQAIMEYDDRGKPLKITGVIHDVTEQKEVERRLAQQQYYLEKAQELGKIGTWELHLENGQLSWTDMTYDIFGIPVGTPVSYEKFLSYVHPDDRKYVNDSWDAALKGEPYDIEHRILVFEEVKWVREKASIKFDAKNRPISAIGFIQDINYRKYAELELAEKEESYRTLLENIGAGVGYYDLEGRVILFNKRAAQNMGGVPGDFTNKSMTELFGEEDGRYYLNRIHEASRTEGLTEYIDQITISGKSRWYHSIYTKIHNISGEIIGVQIISHDITKIKETEEALRNSEERLALIIKGTNEAPWDWDMAKKQIYYSPQWWKQMGYQPNELPADEQLWYQLTHPEDKPKIDEQLANATNSDMESYEIEFRMQHKDGHYVPILSRGIILRDEQGNILRLAGSNMDLTEQKKTQAEIFNAKEKAERYLDMADSMFVSLDTQGNIAMLNQKALEILEYKSHELLGKNWFDNCIPKHMADLVKDTFAQLVKGHHEEFKYFENEIVSKSGTLKTIAWHNSYLHTPACEIEYLLSSGIDITDIKTAQSELRESQERYNLAMQASKDGIFDWNLITNEIYYSPGWKSMLGYAYHEVPNDFSIWESNTHPDDVKRSWEMQQRVVNREIDRFEMEFRMRHKAGHWVDILSRAEAAFDEHGKAIRMVGTHVDISQMKKVEKELLEAKLRAEESDQLKSAFLANMSHEIRTPMNGILGFTNLLREPNLRGDKQQYYIDIIQKSGMRMLDTVNDLIDISRIETGQVDIIMEQVNVDDEMHNLHNFFSEEAENKGLRLLLATKPTPYPTIIKTDRNKFNSIVSNLIKNAIKYTHAGTISVGYTQTEEAVKFFVSDTGIGIPSNRQKAIFERFVQADIHDTKVFEGAGLGLAITKAYVEMLGGNIWLTSVENEGSHFYFTLPHEDAKSEKKEPYSTPLVSAVSPPLKKLNILIAEDDEVSFLHLKILLKEFAGTTNQVRTGTDAIEFFKTHPETHLILMDLKMPEMNGYEATRKIRSLNTTIPIIAQTAYALTGDREKAFDAGCTGYITKPIDKGELFAVMHDVFNQLSV